jgi:hypothetical protein
VDGDEGLEDSGDEGLEGSGLDGSEDSGDEGLEGSGLEGLEGSPAPAANSISSSMARRPFPFLFPLPIKAAPDTAKQDQNTVCGTCVDAIALASALRARFRLNSMIIRSGSVFRKSAATCTGPVK